MSPSRTLIALIFPLLLGQPAAAAEDPCAAFLASIHAVPEHLVANTPVEDCLDSYQQALSLNLPAVLRAAPVSSPAGVLGTWLGDYVLMPLGGYLTPGQEVLRIDEGPEPGLVRVRQYWFKVNLPDSASPPFDAATGYLGLVAEAVLRLDAQGRFSITDRGASVRYQPQQLQFRRANTLWVQAMLNHFDHRGQFLRDGDTLVLESRRFLPPPQQGEEAFGATYTRVSDTAPDLALLLVWALEISQTRYFDCLTHQLGAGQGPLIDALAPFSPAEVLATLSDVAETSRRVDQQVAVLRANAAAGVTRDAADSAAFQALLEHRSALTTTPVMTQLAQLGARDADLGCPFPF